MIEKENMLLIDGHLLLFQMFYGMPSRIIGQNGKSIHAVIGFIGAIIRIIKTINPSYVLIIFDGENGTNKKEIDSNYKTNRTDYSNIKEEDNPFSQLPIIKSVLDYLNIKYYETLDENKTDDHIASYVRKYKADKKIYIVSKDTDFLQLIDDNVSVYMYCGKNSINFTYDKMIEKYGVIPSNYAFYKSLVGDSSDNIKGIKGIGPKTAIDIINKCRSLNELLENINLISKPFVKNAIECNYDKIVKNYELINLSRNVNLPFDLNNIKLRINVDNISTMMILKQMDII